MTGLRTPAVCLITDRRRLAPDVRTPSDEVAALERWLDEAIGRVDLIQIREPDLEAGRLWQLTRRIVARARGSGTAVVVNERADVARAADADGVHLRASSAPVGRVRAVGPPGWLIGRSVHGVEEVNAAAEADYLIFGTIYPSASKPAGAPVQGLDQLREVTAAATMPVLAVGGIDPARAGQSRRAGAAGVAAIGLFLPPGRTPNALGIAAAADALRAAMAQAGG